MLEQPQLVEKPANLETNYLDVLEQLLTRSQQVGDALGTNNRTGTPATKKWCTQLRHDLSEGLPLLTTKKIWLRGLVGELVCFLAGVHNIYDMRAVAGTKTSVWDKWALREDYYTVVSKSSQECLSAFANAVGKTVAEADAMLVAANEKYGYPKGAQMLMEDHGIFQEERVKYKEAGELGPIYGCQWRNFDGSGIDQISELLISLNSNPLGRRHIVTAWNPKVLPDENESHFVNIISNKQVLPPCHYDFVCDVEIDPAGHPTLNLCFDMRSADWFVGVPFNVPSYSILTHLIAKEVRMAPGAIVGDFKNYHLYHDHLDGAAEQLSRRDQRFEFPQFKLHPDVSLRKILAIPLNERLSDESIRVLNEQVNLIVDSVIDYQHHDAIQVDVAV